MDAELVDDAGLLEFLAPLVRDGIVVRHAGPHGQRSTALVGALGVHVRDTRSAERDAGSVRRLVALLAATTGSPRQYLPMQAADRSLRRRLVALEPVLVHALGLARDHDLVAAGADIALFLPELHYAARGNPPPPGRADWLLGRDDLDPGRRIDLLISAATTAVAHNRTDETRRRLGEALALARERQDAGRMAVALAQLSISQLLLTVDLGSDIESEREAVRLAESTKDPVVVAGTLCLLYPSDSTPADLADALARSLAAARSQDHVGLVMMALANLSMAALDQGQPAEAAVHARECAAIAAELHHRGLVPTMLEIAELGELLSGDRSTVRSIAQSVAHAALQRDFRRLSEGLLRFAAGLHRVGRPDEAARAGACTTHFSSRPGPGRPRPRSSSRPAGSSAYRLSRRGSPSTRAPSASRARRRARYRRLQRTFSARPHPDDARRLGGWRRELGDSHARIVRSARQVAGGTGHDRGRSGPRCISGDG